MRSKKKISDPIVEQLRQRINEFKLKLFSYGIQQTQFFSIMKQTVLKVFGKSKTQSLNSQQDLNRILSQLLKKKKNKNDLILEMLTEIDIQYGMFESQQEIQSDKNGKSDKKKQKIQSENVQKDSDQIVKLEHSKNVKKQQLPEEQSSGNLIQIYRQYCNF